MKTQLSKVLILLLSTTCLSANAAFSLSNYQLTSSYVIPKASASEVSAVTWNWDTDTLFVVGDGATSVLEINKQGQALSSMSITGFADTEGLTYIGGNQFVIAEERLQDVSLFTYVAGGSVARSGVSSLSIGPTIGNIGIEGISYDRLSGNYITVKEKTPQAVYGTSLSFANSTISVSNLFDPISLGVGDLSDVQALSNFTSLIGTSQQDNLLIYSQESARLLEVTRSGQVLSSINLGSIDANIEGVTIDSNGVIYLVNDVAGTNASPNFLYVLTTPVPEPQTHALMLAGLMFIVAISRRSYKKVNH